MRFSLPTLEKRIIAAAIFLFVVFSVFEGALRFGLFRWGLEEWVYLPKILLAGIYFYLLIKSFLRFRLNVILVMTGIVLVLQSLIGFIYTENIYQVLFGLWVLVPVLGGLVSVPVLFSIWNNRLFIIAVLLLWLAIIAGVFIEYFFDWPWVGFNYTINDFVIEGNRLWWTSSVRRIAGFGRASYETATQILLLDLIITLRIRSWRSIFVNLVSFLAIIFTTSKITIIILPIIWLILIINNNFSYFRRLYPRLLLIGNAFFVVFSIYFTNSRSSVILLGSLFERFHNTWPNALEIIFSEGNFFFGRGIGGIGTAQRYYEPILWNSADNLLLYLYALFGFWIILFLYWISQLIGNLNINSSLNNFVYIVFITFILRGFTSNTLESPLNGFIFGICIAFVFSIKHRKSKYGITGYRNLIQLDFYGRTQRQSGE